MKACNLSTNEIVPKCTVNKATVIIITSMSFHMNNRNQLYLESKESYCSGEENPKTILLTTALGNSYHDRNSENTAECNLGQGIIRYTLS